MAPTQLSELPRVMYEAGAAVLLVSLETSSVEYANRQALAMSGDQTLPVGVDEWSRRAGLVEPSGRDLADSPGPLSRVALGEPVAGELIRREPSRASGAAAGEQQRQRDAGQRAEDVEGPLWVTGFPLGDEMGDRALVVFLPLSHALAPTAAELDQQMRDRAVIATALSFTISDPKLPDHPLVWTNPAFTAVTGYDPDEVLGRNCRFLQGPATDREAVGRIRQALENQQPVVETLLNYRKDGTAFWNQISLTPVIGPDGELVNYVGVQADVTERVLAEQEREQALAAEQRARTGLALLDRVSRSLVTLEIDEALPLLAEALCEELVPWSLVLRFDGRTVRGAASAGLGEEPTRLRAALADGRASRDGSDPLAELLFGSGTAVAGIVDVGAADAVSGLTAQVVAHTGATRVTGHPMTGRGGSVGLLVTGTPPGDELSTDDLSLLREVARRAGLSVQNAQLYAREHAMAETLQRAMLPETTDIAGLDLWASYNPNLDHAQIGGDWFDVIPTTERTAVVVVGDVVGHDIEAAAVMGQLRSIIRSYAYEVDDPAGVLVRADQLINGMGMSRLASLALVFLRRLDGGSWEASWSSAGHLPPLVRRPESNGGPAEVLELSGGRGTLLGLATRPRSSGSGGLEPGDCLVMYTDGLVERRSRPMQQGLGLLREVLAQTPAPSAAALGEQLLRRLGDAPEDDSAVLVVRVPEAADDPDGAAAHERPLATPLPLPERRVDLPPNRAAIAMARRQIVAACRQWGFAASSDAELVASELVSNALAHGGGGTRLCLSREGEGLRIEVHDCNVDEPRVAAMRHDEPGGHGLRIVTRLATWGWRPTPAGKVVWALLREPVHLTRRHG